MPPIASPRSSRAEKTRGRIRYRRIDSREDLSRAVDLQLLVWGLEARDAIPWSQLLVVARNGGVVLGAFDGRTLVGFVYSQPALDRRGTFLYSKMLGVHPGYRGMGVGRRLKRLQRRRALSLGYDRIEWTFDPLERSAALLNLAYLGARGVRYVRNFYGPGGIGTLHAGLASDRVVVSWELESRRARERARRRSIRTLRPDALPPALLSEDARGGPSAASGRIGLPCRVAIPGDIQSLKRSDPARARRWQRALGDALGGALSRGGVIDDVLRVNEGGEIREQYLLAAATRRRRAR